MDIDNATNIILLLYSDGRLHCQDGKRNKEEKMIGEYGISERNERGELLLKFAIAKKLSIMNTFFKNKVNRKWTWVCPNGKTIRYITFAAIIRQSFKLSQYPIVSTR